MPINLQRAEKIGDNNYQPSIKLDSNLKWGLTEVLNIHKVPFNGISFLRDGFYQCPFCKKSSIKQVMNYMCIKCRSRVIKWKCFVEEIEEKHEFYDHYMHAFHDATDRIMGLLKKKKEKDDRHLPQ